MNIDIVDDLKQPEYTGENRCEPCTILNLAIAAIVGSLIARKSKLGGLLAVGISIALIYLRGYLVPGTPTLTKRYLPPEVLRWFGKEPGPELASGLGSAGTGGADIDVTEPRGSDTNDGVTAGTGTGTGEVATYDEDEDVDPAEAGADGGPTAEAEEETVDDLERYFLDREILEPCEDVDDLCLTDEFEDVWFEEIEAVDEAGIEVEDAVEAFGFDEDPDLFDLDSRNGVYMLVSEFGAAGRWPSRAALLADVGASRALDSWADDWDAYDPETKGQVLNSLRMFLERCPTGGDISMSEETVESCCTSHEVFAVSCDESGERLFEQRIDPVDA